MGDFVLPPWNAEDRAVHGESCLFARNDRARLLFPAESVQRVRCPETGVVYRPGKDYLFEPGNDFITRPEGSAIPFISETELYPPDENCVFYPNAGSNAIRGKVNGGNIRFSPTDGYAKIQFEVDYTARRIDFLPADTHAQQERLPRFRKMLDSAEKLPSFSLDPAQVREGDEVFFRAGEQLYCGIFTREGMLVYASIEEGRVVICRLDELLLNADFAGKVSWFDVPSV